MWCGGCGSAPSPRRQAYLEVHGPSVMRVQPADELPRHHRRLPSPPLPQHRRHRARYHTAVSVEHIHDGRLLVDVRAYAQVRAVLGHGWHRLCHDLWVYGQNTLNTEVKWTLRQCRYGRGIWHSKVRHRYRKRWCFQAGPDHEGMLKPATSTMAKNWTIYSHRTVSHSGCYVWNYCCLRSGGGSADSRKHEGAAWAKLQSIQWLHALSVWPFSRFDWVSSGICNRDSWRCGRQS